MVRMLFTLRIHSFFFFLLSTPKAKIQSDLLVGYDLVGWEASSGDYGTSRTWQKIWGSSRKGIDGESDIFYLSADIEGIHVSCTPQKQTKTNYRKQNSKLLDWRLRVTVFKTDVLDYNAAF